jgi:uncharacterized protein YndB with AHSA1/START domain
MSLEARDILVRKSLLVNVPREHAFRTFTERIDTWWPRAHHIGGKEPFTAMLERAADGSECEWGKVLAWEPPERLLLEWDINADWKHQADLGTEVEIRFVPEGAEATRVILEHRKLERYGDHAQMMKAMFESDGAWIGTLTAMAQAAERDWKAGR